MPDHLKTMAEAVKNGDEKLTVQTVDEALKAGIAPDDILGNGLVPGIQALGQLFKDGEAYLFGALITPLPTASTHIHPDPTRTRKLLLHRSELDRLIGAVERKGFSLIPTALYWKRGRAKLEIALAKGKKAHDKRAAIKDRDWQRDKQRLLRGR